VTSEPPPLIVHVVFRFAIGGLENGVVNLVNRLPQHAWRHAIVALTDVDPVFAKRIARDDVQLISLHKRPGHAVPLYPRIYSLLRKLRPAIVHTRNLAALEAVVPAWAARVPARIHGEHGRDARDPAGTRLRYQWARRVFKPFVTRYVAVAPDLAQYLRDGIGVAQSRIDQIYNGVDTQRFHPSPRREALAGCPFRPGEHWIVGTVGRMDTVKDQVNLAHAFVQAVRMHPAAMRRLRLVLVGDGVLRAQLEAILGGAGLRELAWLPGEREDVPALMQSFDCFVLPSLAEGVSNTILEAMATQLPVVATRVGANAQLVEHGLSGTLVPASDSAALAAAIVAYFGDPALARRHGRAGRQLAEKRFSIGRMVDQYHSLYSSALLPGVSGELLDVETAPRGRRV